MPITREAHESALARAVAASPDPAAGLYGPESLMWRVNREALTFLGGGRAALMQVAHPFVAQAIADHSRTRTDLPGRFQRTFEHVFRMVFGDLEQALGAARRVHAVHGRIRGALPEAVGAFPRGTAYFANDERSLLWVFATLTDTSVLVHELVGQPLGVADKFALYEESKRFALLFGLTEAHVPPDWGAFQRYWTRMIHSDQLAVGTAASDICRFLLAPPRPAVSPAWRWYRVVTAGFLPPRLREAYGFRWGRRQRALFHASVRAIRASYPRLPPRLRHLPAYTAAERRLAGAPAAPDTFERVLERLVLAALQQPA